MHKYTQVIFLVMATKMKRTFKCLKISSFQTGITVYSAPVLLITGEVFTYRYYCFKRLLKKLNSSFLSKSVKSTGFKKEKKRKEKKSIKDKSLSHHLGWTY